MAKHDWMLTGSPPEPGWWPAMWCADASEGIFPVGAYWNGTQWDDDLVERFGVGYYPQKCHDRETAKAIAAANDFEG
jgi:hypothetical protein